MNFSIKTSLLILLTIVVYFGVWRPIRSTVLTYAVKPAIQEFLNPKSEKTILLQEANSISYYIYFKDRKQTTKEYMFKIPGGIFFLLGSIALIVIIGWNAAIMGQFLAVQGIVFMFTIVFLFFGLYVHDSGIFMVDLLNRYGEAIVNLGFVLFFIQEHKKKQSLDSPV